MSCGRHHHHHANRFMSELEQKPTQKAPAWLLQVSYSTYKEHSDLPSTVICSIPLAVISVNYLSASHDLHNLFTTCNYPKWFKTGNFRQNICF